MDLVSFSIGDIPSQFMQMVGFVRENTILCSVLFISYVLYYAYSFVHNHADDSDVREIDLISAGISSILTGLLLIGLDESSSAFSLSNIDLGSMTTIIALGLLLYALCLILCAFTKILPRFLVIILGNSELDVFINMMAMFMTDPEFLLTGTTIFVIGIPLVILFMIQRARRMMR